MSVASSPTGGSGTTVVTRWVFPAPEGPSDAPPFSLAAWHRTVIAMHLAFVVLVGLAARVVVGSSASEPLGSGWPTVCIRSYLGHTRGGF